MSSRLRRSRSRRSSAGRPRDSAAPACRSVPARLPTPNAGSPGARSRPRRGPGRRPSARRGRSAAGPRADVPGYVVRHLRRAVGRRQRGHAGARGAPGWWAGRERARQRIVLDDGGQRERPADGQRGVRRRDRDARRAVGVPLLLRPAEPESGVADDGVLVDLPFRLQPARSPAARCRCGARSRRARPRTTFPCRRARPPRTRSGGCGDGSTPAARGPGSPGAKKLSGPTGTLGRSGSSG